MLVKYYDKKTDAINGTDILPPSMCITTPDLSKNAIGYIHLILQFTTSIFFPNFRTCTHQ